MRLHGAGLRAAEITLSESSAMCCGALPARACPNTAPMCGCMARSRAAESAPAWPLSAVRCMSMHASSVTLDAMLAGPRYSMWSFWEVLGGSGERKRKRACLL